MGDVLSKARLDKRDVERRNRVKRLLDSGAVRTGSDYWVAAMIFHHGSKPDDFLLAHVLACVAISKEINSRWLAAATLDRFLLKQTESTWNSVRRNSRIAGARRLRRVASQRQAPKPRSV